MTGLGRSRDSLEWVWNVAEADWDGFWMGGSEHGESLGQDGSNVGWAAVGQGREVGVELERV